MTQPRAYKTRGIVLRSRNLGEADKIVTLFTTDRGKLDAVAKGVRRAKSHLSGRLEFANECQFGMHRGRTLDVIVSADIVREHWEQIVAPQAFAVAGVVAEVVDALCEPDLAMSDVYALLSGVIAAIAASREPVALLPRFQLRLLEALGFAPPADTCARCGAAISTAWVDEESGALAGPECRERWREALELSSEDLRNFAALSAPRGNGAVLEARPSVAEAIDRLIRHHLGRRPKAGVHVAEFVRPTR